LHVAAERYLIKQLTKTKRIAESPVFTQLDASKRTPPEARKDGATANVIARLFKSHPVRDALPGIMEGIRILLGIQSEDSVGKKPEAAERSQRPVPAPSVSSMRDADDKHESRAIDRDIRSDDEGEEDSDESMGQFDDRLASESESEAGSIDDVELRSKPNRAAYDVARDLSLSPTPSPSRSASESPGPAARKASKASKGQPVTTMFLPSLTVGGYWSGSDSGMDVDEKKENKPERKNRRGQQARRQLWEKKYGAGANHVQKQAQAQSRGRGWDPRKGATDGENGRRMRGNERGAYTRTPNRLPPRASGDNPNAMALGGGERAQRKMQDDKPLHPSWEAAKKAKEQASKVAFQGKKVVFD
jgi:hypothetical protein